MNNSNDLTQGNIVSTLLKFAVPYMLACFMQTFYGMADLFIVGLYNTATTTTAVSIGSQVTHMLTVIIVGLAMGSTILIGKSVGAKDNKTAAKAAGTTVVLFAGVAVVLTLVLLCSTNGIVKIMLTPSEAVSETRAYLLICFAGIPFIIAYNIISSIFRGAGDSRSPMIFVGIACATNIMLDFIFIGSMHMGAKGAALGTIISQAFSSVIAFGIMKHFQNSGKMGFTLKKNDIRVNKGIMSSILKVGIPVAMQDGLIQVAFIVITIIANSRGLVASAAVGIVEKLISFMFLVPSAFLSTISAVTAQNVGAGLYDRARRSLRCGIIISVTFGFICAMVSQFFAAGMVGLFTKDEAVIIAGCQYLKSYSFDCMAAGVHFCFSGYFCGYQKSGISFIHNIASIILVRVPGAYLASTMFPDTLFPMGMAAPLGSVLSAVICVGFYVWWQKKNEKI